MTRLGWSALVLGAALLAAGFALSWAALVVLGAGAIVLLVVAFFYVLRRPDLEIERQIYPPRVAKGEPAIAYLHFTNRSRNTVPTTVAIQPYGKGVVRTPVPRLRGGESGSRTYRLPTTRRGVFEVGPVELSRADPFELIRTTQLHAGRDEIWVYPTVLPLKPIASGVARSLDGPTADIAAAGEITFHRLRNYEVGDDLRMVHWRSTARMGKLMVRHNTDPSEPFTVVLADLRPSVYSAETFETAIDVAASAVVSSSFGGAPVVLRTTTGLKVSGTKRREPWPVLDYLTSVEPDPAGSLWQAAASIRRDRAGTSVIVVTGALDEADLPAIAKLNRKFQRIVVASIVPFRSEAPRYPGVQILVASDGEELCAAWNLEVGVLRGEAG